MKAWLACKMKGHDLETWYVQQPPIEETVLLLDGRTQQRTRPAIPAEIKHGRCKRCGKEGELFLDWGWP